MRQDSNKQQTNVLVRFFSSVKLAVFLFIALAVTSIIGTVLPQGESLQFYLENFGPFWFKVIRTLQLYDTYHAWWYLSLMGLFSINLIVCTVKRLPYTLKLFKKDGLELTSDEIARRPFVARWTVGGVELNRLRGFFDSIAGKSRNRMMDGTEVLFSERGRWGYWGVYLIHVSILVIFAGAVYGSFTGFKGRIMLLEGETTDHAVNMDSHGNVKRIPLGFQLRCDKFVVDFYPNGAPKLFKSDLTILEDGKEILKKSILVNDPLSYKGITFYQSSYQSVPDLRLKVVSSDGQQKILQLNAFNDREIWKEKGLLIGMIKYLPNVHGAPAARIYIGDITGKDGDAVWVLMNHEREYATNGNNLRLSLLDAKERFMTGLQVKKDPGVWIVWLGCAMMVIGFAIVFWVGHDRYWLMVNTSGDKMEIVFAGQTNKNKNAFDRRFAGMRESFDDMLKE